MTRNNPIKHLSLITGAALAMGVSASVSAAPQVNPFGMTELSQGFQLAATEGKCGGSMSKSTEGKCGDSKAKSAEGKCGDGKAKAAEGKCGDSKKAKPEGKCGQAKCGGNK